MTMWQKIQLSYKHDMWFDMSQFGFNGIVRVEDIRHIGRRGWLIDVTPMFEMPATLRVGKVRVLEIVESASGESPIRGS